MSDWNPDSYLKFERERTQPVRDLVARIEIERPARIIDLGCGPGNSTAVLRQRWPKAHIVGLDRSPAMLEKARKSHPDIEWVSDDIAADLSRYGSFDLVFANASLQWQPDHGALMPRLMRSVNSGGALAAQLPRFDEMPMAAAIRAVTELPKYAGFFAGFDAGVHFFDGSLYYEALSQASRALELWATDYYHVLENHPALIDWVASTALRPYLDQLPESHREGFKADLLENLARLYPTQRDGRVFFIFKRFFIVAYKP